MADEKKTYENAAALNDEQLDEVSGGLLQDVQFTATEDISDDIRARITPETSPDLKK